MGIGFSINWDSSTQILVKPIDCTIFLKKEVCYLTTQSQSGEQYQKTVAGSMQLSYCTSCY